MMFKNIIASLLLAVPLLQVPLTGMASAAQVCEVEFNGKCLHYQRFSTDNDRRSRIR